MGFPYANIFTAVTIYNVVCMLKNVNDNYEKIPDTITIFNKLFQKQVIYAMPALAVFLYSLSVFCSRTPKIWRMFTEVNEKNGEAVYNSMKSFFAYLCLVISIFLNKFTNSIIKGEPLATKTIIIIVGFLVIGTILFSSYVKGVAMVATHEAEKAAAEKEKTEGNKSNKKAITKTNNKNKKKRN